MQFLTLQQAGREHYQSQYKYRAWIVVVALILMTGGVFLAAAGMTRTWSRGALVATLLLGWILFWFGVLALTAWNRVRLRLRPTNWLVRMQKHGILVKYRSYLNHHLPPEDPIVVSIPFSDIAWIRRHQIRRNIPGGTPTDDTPQQHGYVEIKLHDEDKQKELAGRLNIERNRLADWQKKWYGRGRSLSRHYPVHVSSDGLVRIEWNVAPRMEVFLSRMKAYVSTEAPATTDLDYRQIDKFPTKQQEDMLLELIATGNRLGAVKVVQLLYGYSTTRAVQFIESLSGKTDGDRS